MMPTCSMSFFGTTSTREDDFATWLTLPAGFLLMFCRAAFCWVAFCLAAAAFFLAAFFWAASLWAAWKASAPDTVGIVEAGGCTFGSRRVDRLSRLSERPPHIHTHTHAHTHTHPACHVGDNSRPLEAPASNRPRIPM